MLIRIAGLKICSCIFLSSLKFLYFGFLVGDGGPTKQLEQYLCITFLLHFIGET